MIDRKRKAIGVLIASLIFGIAAVGLSAQSMASVSEDVYGEQTLDEGVLVTPFAQGCPPNNVCGYSATNFQGARYQIACSQSGNIGGAYMRSARNRCGNKMNFLMIGGSILVCMNPGGNRPNPGLFTSFGLPPTWGDRC